MLGMIMNTEEIILINLNKIAQQKEINLTYTHKAFFIRLLKYAMENGVESDEGYTIDKTGKELAKLLDTSFRMVTQSIQVLTKIGVIERIKGEKTFPRTSTKTIVYKSIFSRKDVEDEGRENI